jgi:hypothetical protein
MLTKHFRSELFDDSGIWWKENIGAWSVMCCRLYVCNSAILIVYNYSYNVSSFFHRYQLVCFVSILHDWSRSDVLLSSYTTVVKELRSKMFGQHPGYFKAVFLKQTRIIIVSIYQYTVYIMFWIMMLYDCYYY